MSDHRMATGFKGKNGDTSEGRILNSIATLAIVTYDFNL